VWLLGGADGDKRSSQKGLKSHGGAEDHLETQLSLAYLGPKSVTGAGKCCCSYFFRPRTGWVGVCAAPGFELCPTGFGPALRLRAHGWYGTTSMSPE
jgi:hypothetical protein